MKFLIVFALCVAAASARFEVPDVAAQEAAEIQQIIDMINNPDIDPAVVAELEALLKEILSPVVSVDDDIAVGPIIVEADEGQHGINVDPVIIEEEGQHDIVVDPVIIEEEGRHDIVVDPIIIEDEGQHGINVDPVIIGPVAPEATSSPLVNIIINVNTKKPTDVAIERPVPVEEDVVIDPTPVIVVDEPEAPVDPVIVAPIVVPEAVINLPDTLN